MPAHPGSDLLQQEGGHGAGLLVTVSGGAGERGAAPDNRGRCSQSSIVRPARTVGKLVSHGTLWLVACNVPGCFPGPVDSLGRALYTANYKQNEGNRQPELFFLQGLAVTSAPTALCLPSLAELGCNSRKLAAGPNSAPRLSYRRRCWMRSGRCHLLPPSVSGRACCESCSSTGSS